VSCSKAYVWNPRKKRKITPKIAIQILDEQGITITYEEVELILEMMYNFAKLALNQQIRMRSEEHDQLIPHPGPG